MRVLIVSAPLQGHLLPLLPLAFAWRDAGHDVLLASGGDALSVDLGGLAAYDVAPGFAFGRIAVRVMLRHPLLARRELAGRGGTAVVGELFGAANAVFVDAVVALAERERPDLIVYEPLGVAGAVAAERLGVPAVLQENNLFPGPGLVAAVAASTPMARHPIGRPVAVITVSPPSLTGPRPGLPMRAVPYSGGGQVPEWLLSTGDRPRIVVSRSTVAGPGGGDPTAVIIAAAPAVDAEIVLVRPPGRLPRLLPGNVRTVGRVPLDRVLPYAAGYVHHGGAGSVLGGLAAGVPQLVVPGSGDRRHNAEAVERRGAGLAAEARSITPEVLNRLVSDAALRDAAGEVRDEMAAMPAPSDVVLRLVARWT
ncbi:nucleotide disphospho-sugar-binding domain-containing protein [Catellatospora methionotrophica]|uniref:nucleotide disphospho-sugar-binding domain-containing protein n=1 Tax=Catellatospora methionotrophica TaxID=121620 RepID=UPI0033D2B142